LLGMDSPRGRLLMIFILACLFSDIARSLKNDDNPTDFKALGILRREKDSTKVKEILPVEVNIGSLVNIFNQQIQKLGDNVTRLDNQLQIVKANEERNQKSFKAELKRCRNESKLLEEEVERYSAAQNSLKEENYRLKNESTAIKAENQRLKMKLEATSHETGIPQGTTSRPGLTWSYILGSCIESSDQDGWILLQQRNIHATSNKYSIFARSEWNDYKDGFEDPAIAYWYGLQKMHEKTSSGRWKVALIYHCGGDEKCAVLNDFKIDGENEKFKLHVGAEVSRKGFESGAALAYENGMQFATIDRDNDRYHNCAEINKGGWWHRRCAYYCPNCIKELNGAGCTHTFMVMKRI